MARPAWSDQSPRAGHWTDFHRLEFKTGRFADGPNQACLSLSKWVLLARIMDPQGASNRQSAMAGTMPVRRATALMQVKVETLMIGPSNLDLNQSMPRRTAVAFDSPRSRPTECPPFDMSCR